MAETCALCGGPVVPLPARSGAWSAAVFEAFDMGVDGGDYAAGLTCLGCAPLTAIPRGMVPANRVGQEAARRRIEDEALARMSPGDMRAFWRAQIQLQRLTTQRASA